MAQGQREEITSCRITTTNLFSRRDQFLNTNVTSIRDSIAGLSTQLCNTSAQAEISANSRQMADMQQMFGIQSALQQCCCDNRAATADLKYTLATEACATRNANTANTQAILDKLCALELDGYRREADNLRSELMYARGQASQTAQTAQILAGQAAEIDGVYNRLKNCPVGTYSVCNPLTPSVGGCGCGVA